MKFASLVLSAAMTAAAFAAEPPAPASTPVERDWQAFEAATRESPPATLGEDQEAFNRWMNERSAKLRKLGMDFYTAYPQDPRRWKAVAEIFRQAPYMDDDPATAANESEAWTARLLELQTALEKSTDATDEARELVAAFVVNRAIMQAYEQDYKGDYSEIQPQIDAFAARFPKGMEVGQTQNMYLQLLRQRRPEAIEPLLSKLLQSPNADIRSTAGGLLAIAQARTTPVEMKFTALDGRKVDLAQLRGKVVLIDFWATWCRPCMAEMPNVRSAYEKFNARGFEVVGIALNNAEDREKLVECLSKNRMPWPQYFDGKGWKNEYTERYAITGIPATLLLDREGKLIGTELRGEELHAAIEKALGPDPAS